MTAFLCYFCYWLPQLLYTHLYQILINVSSCLFINFFYQSNHNNNKYKLILYVNVFFCRPIPEFIKHHRTLTNVYETKHIIKAKIQIIPQWQSISLYNFVSLVCFDLVYIFFQWFFFLWSNCLSWFCFDSKQLVVLLDVIRFFFIIILIFFLSYML